MWVWMRVEWYGGGQPVGETQKQRFRLSSNSSLRVDHSQAQRSEEQVS